MDLSLLPQDTAARPALLRGLAGRLARGNPWDGLPHDVERVLLLGMGSSAFAGEAAAAAIRAAGGNAVAELATATQRWPPGPRTLVVAVSATGASVETVLAATEVVAGGPLWALTNDAAGSLASVAVRTVDLGARDASGVASASYTATLALLLALADTVRGRPLDALVDRLGRAARAVQTLLDAAPDWLPGVAQALDGPDGVYILAPARRMASARQCALMFREVPRRPALACEVGDWSHVDVYLAKTLSYRALLLTGSRWQDEAMRWLRLRGATVVTVGPPTEGATLGLRYPGDDDEEVAVFVEPVIAEVVAHGWWARYGEGSPERPRS